MEHNLVQIAVGIGGIAHKDLYLGRLCGNQGMFIPTSRKLTINRMSNNEQMI